MNKISFYRVVFLASMIAGSSVTYSQANSNDIISLESARKAATTPADAASPSERVLNTFNKMFKNATKVFWTAENKGHPMVYFETPGKKHRAGFDKKGNLVYTISYYQEEQLPQPILLRVKETYFGKSIFCVTEVNYDGKTAYLIILEDKTSWLHIKIVGDEMVEEKVLIKG